VAAGRRVVHVAAHTFTPELDGVVRTADVGLLYDPARRGEHRLAAAWKAALSVAAPQLRVRRNYPYAGKGDGLTRELRLRFPAARYVGIELEVNQALAVATTPAARAARAAVVVTLQSVLAPHAAPFTVTRSHAR
jgi:predicted N-formylglutamate amidohydrolase